MSSNKDFLPSSSPISSICAIEIEATLFLFMLNCYKTSFQECITIIVLKIKRTTEPAAVLFTSDTRKDGIPPPQVGLSWDSPHPPPESVRAYADIRTNIFWIKRFTKFAYPWCSTISAIRSRSSPQIVTTTRMSQGIKLRSKG